MQGIVSAGSNQYQGIVSGESSQVQFLVEQGVSMREVRPYVLTIL